MPLPNGGQIDMNQIQTEFGGVPQIGLNEYYKGGPYVSFQDNAPNVPTSGQIALSNFWGAGKVNIDITQSGLQLYYDFGKTSSYQFGQGAFVFDISGNGRHGNFYNGANVQYDWNGVSQNGTKSYFFTDGVDDFLIANAMQSGWPSGCHTGRGPYTWCFWIRPIRDALAETVAGTVNEGFTDICQLSLNRGEPGRDSNVYRTIHPYVRDGVDDGDYGYSVWYASWLSAASGLPPCYLSYPFNIWGRGWVYICWRVLDNYYHPDYAYNYIRAYSYINNGGICGVNSTYYVQVTNHDWPFNFNCFQYPIMMGAANRRGTPIRHFYGSIGQWQVYNRALSDYEMDYNFDQHRNRYL